MYLLTIWKLLYVKYLSMFIFFQLLKIRKWYFSRNFNDLFFIISRLWFMQCPGRYLGNMHVFLDLTYRNGFFLYFSCFVTLFPNFFLFSETFLKFWSLRKKGILEYQIWVKMLLWNELTIEHPRAQKKHPGKLKKTSKAKNNLTTTLTVVPSPGLVW